MFGFLNQKGQADSSSSPRAFFQQEKRAQAAAPFELFVAVIIMAFVVIVGYNMLEKVNTEVCLNTVDREMTECKINLEDTVVRKSSNSFFFGPDTKCFASKQTTMKIEIVKQRAVCASRCNYPSDECYVMTFRNPNISNSLKQKCIDLPPLTNFLLDQSCQDYSLEEDESGQTSTADYRAVDPTKEGDILIGNYRIVNVSPAGDTYPKVCVWYRAV